MEEDEKPLDMSRGNAGESAMDDAESGMTVDER